MVLTASNVKEIIKSEVEKNAVVTVHATKYTPSNLNEFAKIGCNLVTIQI